MNTAQIHRPNKEKTLRIMALIAVTLPLLNIPLAEKVGNDFQASSCTSFTVLHLITSGIVIVAFLAALATFAIAITTKRWKAIVAALLILLFSVALGIYDSFVASFCLVF